MKTLRSLGLLISLVTPLIFTAPTKAAYTGTLPGSSSSAGQPTNIAGGWSRLEVRLDRPAAEKQSMELELPGPARATTALSRRSGRWKAWEVVSQRPVIVAQVQKLEARLAASTLPRTLTEELLESVRKIANQKVLSSGFFELPSKEFQSGAVTWDWESNTGVRMTSVYVVLIVGDQEVDLTVTYDNSDKAALEGVKRLLNSVKLKN